MAIKLPLQMAPSAVCAAAAVVRRDVQPVRGLGDKPLHQAVCAGEVDEVRRLAERDVACVHEAGRFGWTPLHLAALSGHADVAAFLVTRHGARLDERDALGDTPAHQAARNGHLQVLRLLLAPGAANDRNLEGLTALHHAACHGHADVARFLVDEAGADPALVAGLARRTPLHEAAARGHHGVVAALAASAGAAVLEARDACGRTPLLTAAACGHAESAMALLRAGADVRAADSDGRTALALAEGPRHWLVIHLVRAWSFGSHPEQIQRHATQDALHTAGVPTDLLDLVGDFVVVVPRPKRKPGSRSPFRNF